MTPEEGSARFRQAHFDWINSPRLGIDYPRIGDDERKKLEAAWNRLHPVLQTLAPNETTLPYRQTPVISGVETSPALSSPPRSVSPTRNYVSYAWDDKSPSIVDRLCDDARQRSIEIQRDQTGIEPGESITRFMQELGTGDLVFVILSGKYLKSPNCMLNSGRCGGIANCKGKNSVGGSGSIDCPMPR